MLTFILNAGETGNVAYGRYVRIGGQQVGIDLDTVLDCQSRLVGDGYIGYDTDAVDQEFGGQYLAVSGFNRGNLAIFADESGDALMKMKLDAPGLMCLTEHGDHVTGNRPGHGSLAEIHHVNRRSQRCGNGGKFQTDEASANHHDVTSVFYPGGQRVGGGEGLDAKHTLKVIAWY